MEYPAGEHITLRPITEADTPLIVKWRNNERVRNSFVFREFFTEAMHNAWLHDKVFAGRVIQFIICESDGMRPVGTVFLQDIDRENATADYGFLIGEDDAIGKRYGSECVSLVKDYAVNVLHLKAMTCRIITDNAPSVATMTKGGFQIIGKEDTICSDGTVVVMYLLRLEL